jgi:tetratricopeptide (TPR) repeat protein
LISLLLYAGLAYVAFRGLKTKSPVSWAIIFFVLTMSITSNIVFPVGTFMNERFMYLPSLAFCVLVAWVLVEKLPDWQPGWGKTAGMALLALMVLGFGIRSYTRVPAWENEFTLNEAAIKVSTNSARANSYMGYSLYRKGLEEPNATTKDSLFRAALPYVNRALEIYPEYTDAITAKGGVISGIYQLDRELDPLLDGFYDLLARAHVPFIDEYMVYLNPRADGNKLADFYHRAGFELLAQQKKNYPLALRYLKWGQEVQPNNPRILEDLAITYYNSGNYQMVLNTGASAAQFGVETAKLNEYIGKAQQALGR